MSAPATPTAVRGPIGLIGGSSFLESTYLSAYAAHTVHTPHGAVLVHSNPTHSIHFIQRHHASPHHTYSPPHLINKRAIAAALASLGCLRVIGFGSVGTLRPTDVAVGRLVVPDDFYDIEPVTMFEYDKRGHMSAHTDTPHTHTRHWAGTQGGRAGFGCSGAAGCGRVVVGEAVMRTDVRLHMRTHKQQTKICSEPPHTNQPTHAQLTPTAPSNACAHSHVPFYAGLCLLSSLPTHSPHSGPSFDPVLRSELLTLLSPFNPHPTSTYTQTRGPRFETPAEVRMLATAGHVVGMTCAHEATLCKELGMSYAVVCMVDNVANGLSAIEITYDEFRVGVARNLVVMERVLGVVLGWVEGQAVSLVAVANGAGGGVGKRRVDEVISARWVVTVDDAQPDVLDNHTVVVDKGIIIDILPTSNLPTSPYHPTHTSSFPSGILMPGLINCHTHSGMSLMRGYADDHCLHTWLTEHIWPTEAAVVSPAFVRDSSELAVYEMIRGGTTCMNDMYWFPEVTAEVVDRLGLRAVIGLTVLDFPSAWAKEADEYLRKGEQVRQSYGVHERITFAVAPHAPYTVSDDNLVKSRQLAVNAKTGGHRIHTHLHETAAEVEHSVKGEGPTKHRSDAKCRPLENLHRLGLVDHNLIAVHMTQLSKSDIALLQQTKANVVHCPSSNLKLASGFCPITDLLAAGVTVGLGTDSTASNNALDLMGEMRLAALLAKGVSGSAEAVSARQAVRMATIGGARALGLEERVGSLTVGKEADLIVVEASAIEMHPLYDAVSHLVYCAGRHMVSDVWVRGKRLMHGRHIESFDEVAVRGKVREWEQKLRGIRDELRRVKEAELLKVADEAAVPVLEAPATEVAGASETEAKRQRKE